MNDLTAIRIANDARRARKAAATPGPWYDHNPDDEQYMNCFAVTTKPIEPEVRADEGGNDHGDIVALTLIQSPRLACHSANKWDCDAAFIAAARNDPVEDVIDALCEEIATLRRAVRDVRLAVEGVTPP